ncbi:MAG: hypothetical protein IT379_20150 [Deltaproteobacteria bacterium]|nr:hypothetical protein [Deltaproteobacteria bacterium]
MFERDDEERGPAGGSAFGGGDAAAHAPSTAKAVYTIVERGPGRRFWVRIGAAFTNRDGSIAVRLDAFPADRTLQIRDPFPPRAHGRMTSDDVDDAALRAVG